MGHPLVSVAMVAYNHERFVRHAIESALNQQTAFSFEIVVGEDCSTDSTGEILAEYESAHPNVIRLIRRNKNLGMQWNYARTVQECCGEFIAVLDSDDHWISPDKLAIQVAQMRANPSSVISFHRAMVLHDREEGGDERGGALSAVNAPPDPKGPNTREAAGTPDPKGSNTKARGWGFLSPGDDGQSRSGALTGRNSPNAEESLPLEVVKSISNVRDILLGNFIPSCTVMYRRAAMADFPDWYGEVNPYDWVLHTRTLLKGGQAKFFDETLSAHRIHGTNNFSSVGERNRLEHVIGFYEHIRPCLPSDLTPIADYGLALRYMDLANHYRRRGEKKSAIEAFEKAVSLQSPGYRIPTRKKLRLRAMLAALNLTKRRT